MHVPEKTGMARRLIHPQRMTPFVSILPLLFIGKRTIIINKRIEKTFLKEHFIFEMFIFPSYPDRVD
jgi:hypothetical protein